MATWNPYDIPFHPLGVSLLWRHQAADQAQSHELVFEKTQYGWRACLGKSREEGQGRNREEAFEAQEFGLELVPDTDHEDRYYILIARWISRNMCLETFAAPTVCCAQRIQPSTWKCRWSNILIRN